jgi:hypothetical protein
LRFNCARCLISFKKIGALLDGEFKFAKSNAEAKLYGGETIDFLNLVKNWDKIVGDKLALNTRPLKLQRKTLLVITRHPSYASQLHFVSQDILQKIFKLYPSFKNLIHEIKYRASNSFHEEQLFENIDQKHEQKQENAQTFHKLSPQYRELKLKAEEMFAHVEDAIVREQLENIFIQSQLNNK